MRVWTNLLCQYVKIYNEFVPTIQNEKISKCWQRLKFVEMRNSITYFKHGVVFTFCEVTNCRSFTKCKAVPTSRKKQHSRGRFRSIDLWVMGPALFRCATLLQNKTVKKLWEMLILQFFFLYLKSTYKSHARFDHIFLFFPPRTDYRLYNDIPNKRTLQPWLRLERTIVGLNRPFEGNGLNKASLISLCHNVRLHTKFVQSFQNKRICKYKPWLYSRYKSW